MDRSSVCYLLNSSVIKQVWRNAIEHFIARPQLKIVCDDGISAHSGAIEWPLAGYPANQRRTRGCGRSTAAAIKGQHSHASNDKQEFFSAIFMNSLHVVSETGGQKSWGDDQTYLTHKCDRTAEIAPSHEYGMKRHSQRQRLRLCLPAGLIQQGKASVACTGG